MNTVIYFFGSGLAFLVGLGLLLLAIGLLIGVKRNWLRSLASLLSILGAILVALSATPLPYWLYVSGGIVWFAWLIVERVSSERGRRWRVGLRVAVVAVVGLALALEMPYQFTPRLDPGRQRRLTIFADSVTAGTGDKVRTWPRLLAAGHPIQVIDHSEMGATVQTMLRKARTLTLEDGVVLLEIGGNDLLGTTSAAVFEERLDELLALLAGEGRTLVMFELPLPPFANAFGLVQRRLASKHDVVLVPKRVFAAILTANQATIDSIHLSPTGHERMADVVWHIIEPACAD
ncbi:MAG: GDSL-type esterase/lipase family protein [Gemmataceae bacterium]